jgi:hypothetical protein
MFRGIRVSVALLLAMWLLPPGVAAQGTSAGTITGVVKDTSGAVLPGVTVEAASPALIEKVRTAVTDASGEYRIAELRPGVYSVTFTLPGFSTLKRDEIELRTSFTATINAELKVGGLQETITVSGGTPLVDVQTATQQRTISRELLDAVPTAKSILGIAALMPSVVEPPNAQDVGGSKGERSVRISVHGGKTFDSRLLQDGMRYNALTPGIGSSLPFQCTIIACTSLEGTGRGYYVNPLSSQEIIIDSGTMGSAEYSLGGAQVNSIPKEGGNQFAASVFLGGTGHRLQADNLTDSLREQGLTSVNTVRKVYDFNGALGGPIMKDRLWFFASARRWGTQTSAANLYHDANTSDFVYTADLSRPVYPKESDKGAGVRLTYQATSKDKVTFSYDKQRNAMDQLTGQLETGTAKYESLAGYCQRHDVTQGTWTRPQSSRLLFDAGVTVSRFNFSQFGEEMDLSDFVPCGGGLFDNVSINDTGLGYTYNGVGSKPLSMSHQSNGRVNMSVSAGGHNFKTGLFWMYGLGGGHRVSTIRSVAQVGGLPVSYTFNNGTPTSLTQFASPTYTIDQLNPDLGLFVQDQWRLKRVTLTAGLRFDWVRESVGATSVPAGVLVDARSYPAVKNVPNWKDLNPRLGVVWDPFGDGRTAVKAGINRYVQSNTTGVAQLFDQAAAAVNSTARSWTDGNGNFLPDCNLRSTAANGECGAMANANFGSFVAQNHPDPDWITGWGKRGYNWQTSVSIDREVLPSLSVSAGYFRTWYGNFMVWDNQAVTPGDFSPYCVTAPTDPRLPTSGQQLCGLYDINPNKFGQVSTLYTLSDNYGTHREVYNGVDATFQLRVRDKGSMGGGWNIGNSVQQGTTAGGNVSTGTDTCYVIDSPQQLFNCKIDVPYQSRFRVNGSYALPYDVQLAAVFQTNPGATYNANRTYTVAEIQPSLGRALAGGTRTVSIPLAPPFSLFGPRINQLDLRGSKIFRLGSRRLQANVDLYNVTNSSTAVNFNSTYNAVWRQPTQILDARLLKFSVQVDF